MPHSLDDSSLADRRYVTMIARLTLDQAGQVVQGELLDTTDTLRRHFIGVAGLREALEAWLQQQAQPKINATPS
jgi:hypothetical protein